MTFRAYKKVEFLKIDFMKNLEKCTNSTFSNAAANRWISVRLDYTAFIIIIANAAFALGFKNRLEAGLLGFSM